jgi:hypothetical protein
MYKFIFTHKNHVVMVMGMEVMLHEFLAFQLDPSRRILIPCAFICRKSPWYHGTEGLVDPKAILDDNLNKIP